MPHRVNRRSSISSGHLMCERGEPARSSSSGDGHRHCSWAVWPHHMQQELTEGGRPESPATLAVTTGQSFSAAVFMVGVGWSLARDRVHLLGLTEALGRGLCQGLACAAADAMRDSLSVPSASGPADRLDLSPEAIVIRGPRQLLNNLEVLLVSLPVRGAVLHGLHRAELSIHAAVHGARVPSSSGVRATEGKRLKQPAVGGPI
jgi:hypothetical protein